MSFERKYATKSRLFLAAWVVVALMALTACTSSSFSIQGTWKSIGDSGWGQAQPGAIVRFTDSQASLYSPQDTYALTKSGDNYLLDVTGMLGGGGSFMVKVIDNDNIELYSGSSSTPTVKLMRVG